MNVDLRGSIPNASMFVNTTYGATERRMVMAGRIAVIDPDDVVACCAPIRQQPIEEPAAAQLARQFAALADPVRLQLLSLLATSEDGAVCACDLVEPVGRSQPTVSHHLKILREAGLVTSEKRGVNVWYAAVPQALELLRDALGGARPPR